ncbi:ragulator complex protein LAMTOR4 homolog isoform X2 [Fopius arisanus]|uniref:Late endosomal/lysosomal adaptor and MAPK and MTOR activator 4 n=1 Tax=Fopius arisanus TaxID=64838 RepID=A0A9R1TQB1_9HYME|nr:PREDICTED: ragulator complex protein LAMTOR4 homolog isoform X2 [Fopius arisanus]
MARSSYFPPAYQGAKCELAVQSGGELENDEWIANIVTGLVTMTDKIDPNTLVGNETFNKISIVYPNHCYVICLSNKKIHVLKKKNRHSIVAQQIGEQHNLIEI